VDPYLHQHPRCQARDIARQKIVKKLEERNGAVKSLRQIQTIRRTSAGSIENGTLAIRTIGEITEPEDGKNR
jgi:hypothetical protein